MSAEKQIMVHGIEHHTASEAIQHLDCGPEGHDVAVSIGSRYFSMTEGEFGRLQEARVDMTTWYDLLVTVPGRSGYPRRI